MSRFIRHSPEALGSFGFTLIFVNGFFASNLRDAKGTHFWACTSQAALLSICIILPILLIATNFFWNSSRPRPESALQKERQGREERLRVGYLPIARDVFLVDLVGGIVTMTTSFFSLRPKLHFDYGHYLLAGVLMAVTATTVHLLWLKFSDRLTLDPPHANLPATQQLRWLFKGNK